MWSFLKIWRPKEKGLWRDFPSGPVVKTLPSNAGGMDLVPGQQIKVPHPTECNRKLKSKQNNNSKKNYGKP